MSDRITHLGSLQLFDTRNDKAYTTGRELGTRHRLRRKYANLFNQILCSGSHQQNFIFGFQDAINHAHQHYHADIVIKP